VVLCCVSQQTPLKIARPCTQPDSLLHHAHTNTPTNAQAGEPIGVLLDEASVTEGRGAVIVSKPELDAAMAADAAETAAAAAAASSGSASGDEGPSEPMAAEVR
jgi:hypothetical protein